MLEHSPATALGALAEGSLMASPKRFVNRKATGSVPRLSLGDRVRILHFSDRSGRVVELRGPLGPDGAQIYRVRIGRKPNPTYIEVRAPAALPRRSRHARHRTPAGFWRGCCVNDGTCDGWSRCSSGSH
jgi:hypothetical protein